MKTHRFAIAAVSLLAGLLVPLAATAAPASADPSCTTSDPHGACFLPQDTVNFPGIELGSGRDPSQGIEVDQNIWNADSCPGMTQSLAVTSDQSWDITANVPTSTTGAVCSYPNIWPHDAQGKVDNYSTISQTFAESFPHDSTTVGHAMDDLWFDNWKYEVMVQYDFSNDAPCEGSWPEVATNIGFSGQKWHLCQSSDGASLVWKLGAGDGSQEVSESSGTLHILSMVKWLETNGYLGTKPAKWTAYSTGFEIQSTGGITTDWSYSALGVDMVKTAS